MYYKHKETGKYYECGNTVSENGIRTDEFICIDRSITEPILIKTKMSDPVNPYTMDVNEQYKAAVAEMFDKERLEPVCCVSDKPKYVEVVLTFKCPLCGSELIHDGGTLLSYPPQYPHACPKCGYKTAIRRFRNGQIVLAESKEDAYRIISSGTEDELDDLSKRSRK